VELDRGFKEGRLAINQRTAHVTRLVSEAPGDSHDREDELLWLMQGGDDLLPRDHHGICAVDAALHLDEAKVPGLRIVGGDVVAYLLS